MVMRDGVLLAVISLKTKKCVLMRDGVLLAVISLKTKKCVLKGDRLAW